MKDLPPKSGRICLSSLLTSNNKISCQRKWLPTSIPLRSVRISSDWISGYLALSYVAYSYSFLSQSFTDVPITDAGVDTLAFLEASEGLLGLFGASALPRLGTTHPLTLFRTLPHGEHIARADLLGSAALAPVQSDIKGNIVVSWQDR
jgi:hypothetical protein